LNRPPRSAILDRAWVYITSIIEKLQSSTEPFRRPVRQIDRRMKSDVEIFADAMAGGPEAFAPIVEHYQDAVFGIALARVRNFHQAEDIAQGVFVEAFERLGNLNDPGRLGAWLRTITIHHSIDHLRKRREVTGIEQMPEEASPVSTWRAREQQRDLREQVLAAIGRLSKVQRETTTLFYINGYSVQEVAAIQEVPAGTVKRRLHDAREKLKEEMMKIVENTLKAEAPKDDFGQRVFDLVCRYKRPAPAWPMEDLERELRRIGVRGIAGFEKAMSSPHSPTRRFALRLIALAHRSGPSTEREGKEAAVQLLKEALHDSNRRVRYWAVPNLLELEVDDARKRNEFIPLVLPLLEDRTARVRTRVAWELGGCVEWESCRNRFYRFVPLEVAARSLADENDPLARIFKAALVRAIIDAKSRGEYRPVKPDT